MPLARVLSTPRVALLVFLVALTPVAGHAQQFEWPEKAKNLRVLPKNISKDDLRTTMVGYARALGVRCQFCHVGEEGKPLTTFDFASDNNPMKGVARGMVKMVGGVQEDLHKIKFQEQDRVRVGCITCHHGKPRPVTLVDELRRVYVTSGIDSTLARYMSLRIRYYGRDAYDFGEGSLSDLSSELLDMGRYDDAIRLLKLNLDQYPQSSRSYDALGEAYQKAGKKDEAIQASRKALELDPRNHNAEERLKELGADAK